MRRGLLRGGQSRGLPAHGLTYFYLHFDLNELVNYPFWLAQYNATPSFYYHFDMWQYGDAGIVPGIDGKVDLNIHFIPKN